MCCQWYSVYIRQTGTAVGTYSIAAATTPPFWSATRQCLHKTILCCQTECISHAHLAWSRWSHHIFLTPAASSPSKQQQQEHTHKEITSIVTFINIFIPYVYSSLISMAPSAAGLSVLKAMALIVLNNATSCYCIKVWCSCSITDYGLGLTTMAWKTAKDGQNAEWGNENHSGNQQGHNHWGQGFILDLPPMQTRRRVPQPTSFGLILSRCLMWQACLMGISIASHSGKLFLILCHLTYRSCCQTVYRVTVVWKFQVRWH